MKTFFVKSYIKYTYFRLIVNVMPDFVNRLRINTIKLFGTPILDDIPTSETFTTLQRSIDVHTNKYNKRYGNMIDGADLYRPTYSTYSGMYDTTDNTQYNENIQNNKSGININRIANLSQDVLLYTSIFTGIFIIGVLLGNSVKK